MSVVIERHRFTVEDYHRMREAGILGEDDRIELIDGELIAMSPIGSRHASCVTLLTMFFASRLEGRALVSIQNPVRLGRVSEPEPDVAILQLRDDGYARAHPTPADVRLLIEVSDTTLAYDREVKLPLYARHEVPEVWIISLDERCVYVHREPAGDRYADVHAAEQGCITPAAFPELDMDVQALFS